MQNSARLTEGEFTFRDLNKNGRLDPYEDSRRPIDERVEDLLSQMTLEEKAGLMFHMIAAVNKDGSLNPPSDGFMRGAPDQRNGQYAADESLQRATRCRRRAWRPSGITTCRRWPRARAWAFR